MNYDEEIVSIPKLQDTDGGLVKWSTALSCLLHVNPTISKPAFNFIFVFCFHSV